MAATKSWKKSFVGSIVRYCLCRCSDIHAAWLSERTVWQKYSLQHCLYNYKYCWRSPLNKRLNSSSYIPWHPLHYHNPSSKLAKVLFRKPSFLTVTSYQLSVISFILCMFQSPTKSTVRRQTCRRHKRWWWATAVLGFPQVEQVANPEGGFKSPTSPRKRHCVGSCSLFTVLNTSTDE